MSEAIDRAFRDMRRQVRETGRAEEIDLGEGEEPGEEPEEGDEE